MGDWFQVLVAPDISAAEAKGTGDRILGWLVAERVVSAETKDCVLGADVGHPPGSQYVRATGVTDPNLLSLWTNGLEVVCGRTVFHSGQGGSELVCDACMTRFEPLDRWGDAVNEWSERSGPGDLACPVCEVPRPVDRWRHDPPWGFGELGFKFWNWPPLAQSFVNEFERRFGSRIVRVQGKL